MRAHWLVCFLLLSFSPFAALAEDSLSTAATTGPVFDERFDDWPLQLKINGRIIASNTLTEDVTLDRLLAERFVEKSVLVIGEASELESLQNAYEALAESVATRLLSEVKPNDEELSDVDLIAWHDSRELTNIPPSELLNLKQIFERQVSAGGTLLVLSPAYQVLGKFHRGGTVAEAANEWQEGFNLIPDSILHPQANDTDGEANDARLPASDAKPRCVDICLQENAALILNGRKLLVVGSGRASVSLRKSSNGPSEHDAPVYQQTIAEAERGQRPKEWLVDLTQCRRRAIDLTLEAFPPASPREPFVDNGALIIVGGGGMPDGLMDQFIELAGGKEDARLVYVPCSEDDEVGPRPSMVRSWQKSGVQHATFVHTKDRTQANEDQAFLEPLKDATGIWFGGGRQWNFADSYYGTEAHRLMKQTLARGGVIGGSSAGASIQARYLARATPIENYDIMAPGYERGGLGFISGVAIDQHFSQRGRQKDMSSLVDRYPQLLGIGIDETTAIVVQKSTAEVVGRGKVHFYDRNRPTQPEEPDYIAIEAGQKYDMVKRKVITE